jgi:hypothetical protein
MQRGSHRDNQAQHRITRFGRKLWRAVYQPLEHAMSSGAGQAFLLSAGCFVISFVAIYVLKYFEQLRGASAPNIDDLAGARTQRQAK